MPCNLLQHGLPTQRRALLGPPIGFHQSLREDGPVGIPQGAIVRVGHTGLIDNFGFLLDCVGRVDDALFAGSVNGRESPAAGKVVPGEHKQSFAIRQSYGLAVLAVRFYDHGNGKGVTFRLYRSVPLQEMPCLYGINRHHPMFIHQVTLRFYPTAVDGHALITLADGEVRHATCRQGWQHGAQRMVFTVDADNDSDRTSGFGRNQIEVMLPTVVQQAIRTSRLQAAIGFFVEPSACVRLVATFCIEVVPDESNTIQPVTQVIALADDTEQCHGALQPECRLDGISDDATGFHSIEVLVKRSGQAEGVVCPQSFSERIADADGRRGVGSERMTVCRHIHIAFSGEHRSRQCLPFFGRGGVYVHIYAKVGPCRGCSLHALNADFNRFAGLLPFQASLLPRFNGGDCGLGLFFSAAGGEQQPDTYHQKSLHPFAVL